MKLACFIDGVKELSWNYSLKSFNIFWCLTVLQRTYFVTLYFIHLWAFPTAAHPALHSTLTGFLFFYAVLALQALAQLLSVFNLRSIFD